MVLFDCRWVVHGALLFDWLGLGCVYLVWVDCLLWMNLPGCVSCVLLVGLAGLMVVGCCCLQVC